MIVKDWAADAADEITRIPRMSDEDVVPVSDIIEIIAKHCPFKPDVTYMEVEPGVAYEKIVERPSPLLQCIDCHNTESPAGAMARQFNHGRCLHCGGYFKVVRA